jgi:diguanylate cyclase (GGDEF)-like protein
MRSAAPGGQQAAALTAILAEVSREALQGDGLDAVLQHICDCVVRNLPVAIASIILLDEAGTGFEQEVWAGELDLEPPALAAGWPVTMGATGRCARTGVPQLIVDVDSDPDYVPGNAAVRAEYLVPIRHRDRLHGVLNIESTRRDFFDVDVRAVFDAIADQVAGAIHLARLAGELAAANRKLELLSMSDGLTGVGNRRSFDQRLAADWSRLAAEGRPLALLLVDADHFKALNDACGHLHGDECLRALARLCSKVADGGEDLVARFGGEEMIVMLPGRDLAAAAAIAERLRLRISDAAMLHPDSPVASHLTVSIGVAAEQPDPAQPAERLLAAADRALYAAKAGGRNRVVAGHQDFAPR